MSTLRTEQTDDQAPDASGPAPTGAGDGWRTLRLALLAFAAGLGAAVGLFFGLRFLIVAVQHGGVW